MAKATFLSKLAFIASIFALCVIALGAFTRLIDAGLGCPDWPFCYGKIIVPMSDAGTYSANLQYPNTPLVVFKAWAEMLHRYFVGGLSLFILSIILFVFIQKENRKISNIILALCLISLLIYQIILGQLTVTLKLLPIVVTQHLLGGFFILATLWLIYLFNRKLQKNHTQSLPRFLVPSAILLLIFVLIQIFLGAWVSTNYASLSCPDFPFCTNNNLNLSLYLKEAFNIKLASGINYEGGVLPEIIRQTIQRVHRYGALVLTLYFFIFFAVSYTKLKKYTYLLKSLYLIAGLLCLQICIGITNVIFKLPLITAISHNLLAVFILLTTITFIFKLTPSKKTII